MPVIGGLPLGLFGKLKSTAGSVSVGLGEAIYLYTDGITEAKNSRLDDFTNERLVESLAAAAALPCEDILELVGTRLLSFTAGAPQSDDMTMLALRRLPDRPA